MYMDFVYEGNEENIENIMHNIQYGQKEYDEEKLKAFIKYVQEYETKEEFGKESLTSTQIRDYGKPGKNKAGINARIKTHMFSYIVSEPGVCDLSLGEKDDPPCKSIWDKTPYEEPLGGRRRTAKNGKIGSGNKKNKRKAKVNKEKSKKAKSTGKICNICLSPTTNRNRIKTTCGHTSCKDCLRTWCEQQPTCPECRRCIRDKRPELELPPTPPQQRSPLHDGGPMRIEELAIEQESPPPRAYFRDDGEDIVLDDLRNRVGDIIHFVPDNQLGIRIERIAVGANGERYLEVIGDYEGLYDAEDGSTGDSVGGRRRRIRRRRIMGRQKASRKKRGSAGKRRSSKRRS